jgi:hypothetical protein
VSHIWSPGQWGKDCQEHAHGLLFQQWHVLSNSSALPRDKSLAEREQMAERVVLLCVPSAPNKE